MSCAHERERLELAKGIAIADYIHLCWHGNTKKTTKIQIQQLSRTYASRFQVSVHALGETCLLLCIEDMKSVHMENQSIKDVGCANQLMCDLIMHYPARNSCEHNYVFTFI
jgi:hypothetical protein